MQISFAICPGTILYSVDVAASQQNEAYIKCDHLSKVDFFPIFFEPVKDAARKLPR